MSSRRKRLNPASPRRGAGRQTRAPRRSPTARGMSAAPAFPQRSGAALPNFKTLSVEVELHVHAAMDPLGARPSAEDVGRRASLALMRLGCAGMCPDVAGLRTVAGKTGVVGHRLLVLGAGRIVLGQGAPVRREGGEAKRNRCGARGHRVSFGASRPCASTPRQRSSTSRRRFQRR